MDEFFNSGLTDDEWSTSSEDEQECSTQIATTSSGSSCSKKRKRPKQVQSFVDSWLTDKQFKDLLTKKAGVGTDKKPQPFCKTCRKFLTCPKTGLKCLCNEISPNVFLIALQR
jgi:hypothetical protein